MKLSIDNKIGCSLVGAIFMVYLLALSICASEPSSWLLMFCVVAVAMTVLTGLLMVQRNRDDRSDRLRS